MRRGLSILLVLVILGTGLGSYAGMEDKLAGHWSRDMIQAEFLTYYFPYLGRDKFARLDPDEHIRKREFIVSLAALYKDYGLDLSLTDFGIGGKLNREDILKIIGKGIGEFDLKKQKNKALPFKDINTMDNTSIELLRLLYNLDVINGRTQKTFEPDEFLSQAEAIIILQRLKGVLKPMENISFNTMGKMQSYDNKESLIMKDLKDRVSLTITKSFPTPGYSLSVEKIQATRDGYKVHLATSPPNPDAMQMQVITYKTITIEIDKDQLKKPAPYKFIVEGEDFSSGL